MQKQHQGKDVTVVRSARAGDPDFDANKTDQVVVRFEDGSVKTVSNGELTNKPA